MATLEEIAFKETTDSDVENATNGVATAELPAAGSGYRWWITGISYSYNGQPAAATTCDVLNGATVVDRFQIPAAASPAAMFNYTRPIKCAENATCSVVLGAGGAGITGTAVIKAFRGRM